MPSLRLVGVELAHAGQSPILSDLDLHLAPGWTGVVGANGAGKTTLLRALSRLLPLRAGSIRFDGHELADEAPHRVTRMGLVHVPQAPVDDGGDAG